MSMKMATINQAAMFRRILIAPAPLRSSLIQTTSRSALLPISLRTIHPPSRLYSSPNITQKNFWVSLIPKPLRKDARDGAKKAPRKPKSTEWNPATFYIVIFLLIGSMAIQMIALRMEFTAFTRRADVKIELLKEIIGRVQNGEDIDVEGLLGTGDAVREKEWEEVIKEMEREDEAWDQSQKSKPKHGRNLEEAQTPETIETILPRIELPPPKDKPKRGAPPGFY